MKKTKKTNDVKVKYIKADKVYHVKKKAWRPKQITLWLLLPLAIFLGLGIYSIVSGIGYEAVGQLEYQVKGDIDYKVYLKENDYYPSKFLGKDMQYIASLISLVQADFSYKLLANEALNAHYQYEVIAELKVTDRADKSKVLYEHEETLASAEMREVQEREIEIREDVSIDYEKYNDYVRAFRTEFGLAANCELNIKLNVNVDGQIKTQDVLAMVIPLSEQTVDIVIDAGDLNRTETLGGTDKVLYAEDAAQVGSGSVVVILSLLLAGVVIYYYVTRFNDDLYEKALRKILKEYDTYIVEANEAVYKEKEVVRVASFKELLDAQNLENVPIVFLEVEPGNKAYFIVRGANSTYRFTLSRAYQEKLKLEEEGEA